MTANAAIPRALTFHNTMDALIHLLLWMTLFGALAALWRVSDRYYAYRQEEKGFTRVYTEIVFRGGQFAIIAIALIALIQFLVFIITGFGLKEESKDNVEQLQVEDYRGSSRHLNASKRSTE